MVKDPRTDPKAETSYEIQAVKSLADDKNALQEYWNGLFRSYYHDVLEDSAEIGRHGVIAEYINWFVPRGKILDVGCGTGILAGLLDPLRYSYLGIDISDVAIDIARQKYKHSNIDFQVTTIEGLKNRDSISTVVFNEVLYYLDFKKALAAAKSIVGKDGFVLISLFDFDEGRELLDQLDHVVDIRGHVKIQNILRDLQWNILIGPFR